MRYTESRLAKAAMQILADLDKGTVDFKGNYDESERKPVVLPSRIPNLLVNGAGGIAVGMATNIPPHNLNEVVDACQHLLRHPEASIDELMSEGMVDDPQKMLSELARLGARLIIQRAVEEEFDTWLGRARY